VSYIDTPVNASGMTVRLVFAVAAFLEPEILVMRYGDAEFQKKPLARCRIYFKKGW
jgi:lipopolysaccharide transport system ATP-binding protein